MAAALLLGEDAEGRLCVRKTPGAIGWAARPAWAPEKAPATVYSWSARLLLCDSGRGSGELLSCEAWLLAVLAEAGVAEAGVVETKVVLAETEAEAETEVEAAVVGGEAAEAAGGFLFVLFFFLLFCSSCDKAGPLTLQVAQMPLGPHPGSNLH